MLAADDTSYDRPQLCCHRDYCKRALVESTKSPIRLKLSFTHVSLSEECICQIRPRLYDSAAAFVRTVVLGASVTTGMPNGWRASKCAIATVRRDDLLVYSETALVYSLLEICIL